uniref:Uncharacterized protein n=1 Tax=uncultured Desulfobacterium sp. TaxID=201089 RepID=E1YJM7_9BACT|nr:unknown protein [uncultured Desulfobacterium sp.]
MYSLYFLCRQATILFILLILSNYRNKNISDRIYRIYRIFLRPLRGGLKDIYCLFRRRR